MDRRTKTIAKTSLVALDRLAGTMAPQGTRMVADGFEHEWSQAVGRRDLYDRTLPGNVTRNLEVAYNGIMAARLRGARFALREPYWWTALQGFAIGYLVMDLAWKLILRDAAASVLSSIGWLP